MKAKRGDLAVIVQTVRDFYVGEAPETRTQVTAGRVTSITREGVVKTVEVPWSAGSDGTWSAARAPLGYSIKLLEKEAIDVSAALDAYRARRYPNTDSTMTRPLDSLDEMRDMLRPFLTKR